MPLKLTGIVSENDFYTSHYMSAVLEEDIKSVFARWSETEPSTADLVQKLRQPWQAMRRDLDEAVDTAARMEAQRPWLRSLCEALGYEWHPQMRVLEDGMQIPIVGEIARANGAPELWLIELVPNGKELDDPLALPFRREQFPQDAIELIWPEDDLLEDLIAARIFSGQEPPRWLLLFHAGQLVVLDRSKWAQRRLLRFDFAVIFKESRDETRYFAALAARESVSPAEGSNLLDRLDESSHKHAFQVSTSLKYAVREAIELIGNEVVYYLRESHLKIHDEDKADELSRECLRFLYRLLFLFYVEARPGLGYAPMTNDEYRTGYSLESLRELALLKVETEESRNGFYLDDSIRTLFSLVYKGFSPSDQMSITASAAETEFQTAPSLINTFEMKALEGDLFDDSRTPTLARVRLRNHTMQRVLELLGYSDRNRALGRGRISYAQLGINQLGAVYEGLLSYTGFFAKHDLYEVKKAETKKVDPLEQAWFVGAEDLKEYDESEIVFDEDTGRPKRYPGGTYIYRLSGRARQKSASYYTPEVLTRCVVKYALKELLQGKTADQILDLTVCEPALGSGAFLNEAINQFADAYLERKQAETGRKPTDENEKQKVKAFIAANRVFGVDRNPIATELAEISLWLNTIYQGHTIPWFGAQFAVGNSMIGARRQWFRRGQLTERAKSWLEAIPECVSTASPRPHDGVYHFLVPDKGMASYGDRVVNAMCPGEMKRISDWRKTFREQFDTAETDTLVRLSGTVDRLWTRHTADLRNARTRTAHDFGLWGQPSRDERGQKLTTRERDAMFRNAINPDRGPSTPYQRLRFVMDYWCALWFWPIEKAHLLPTRHEFLLEVGSVLEGTVRAAQSIRPAQGEMFGLEQQSITVADEYGLVNIKDFCQGSERLTLIGEIAGRYRFLHWELQFADVFSDAGGFDLMLGNPPWIKIEWNEGAVMGDVQPLYTMRDVSAPQMAMLREKAMQKYPELRGLYLNEYAEFEGTQAFLNARQNYPLLMGSQSNTFKCFVTRATELAKGAAYVHDDGMFNDPKAGALRDYLYPRLRYWFQFENEVPLFEGLNDHGRMRFEVSVLGPPREVRFSAIADVFWPTTIDASFAHDGSGRRVEGRKTEKNEWSVAGHRDRIITVDNATLELFASLYDEPGTPPMRARLPVLRARELVDVLRRFAAHPSRLGQLAGRYIGSEMWHETNAVKKDHTIRPEAGFPKTIEDVILSGPHVHVANPRFKAPRADCNSRNDYDLLDLTYLPENHLPRCNFVPDCDLATYRQRMQALPWDESGRVADCYRLVHREMAKPEWERTLLGAIEPPGPCHINVLFGTAFEHKRDLLCFASSAASLPVDFRVRTTGMGHINKTLLDQLPLPKGSPALFTRTLLLNCLTVHYAELWRQCWDASFTTQRWAKSDPRLRNERFSTQSPQWAYSTPLRTDYERREALVEIDVLVAMELGLTVEELCTIYRIQFDLLNRYERNTYYDRNGRIVYLDGDQAFGLPTAEWKKKRHLASIERTVTDDTLPGGPRERAIVYEAPYDQCDREEDYRMVWAEFERRQE